MFGETIFFLTYLTYTRQMFNISMGLTLNKLCPTIVLFLKDTQPCSCQTQLILLVDGILRAMDQHYQADLDFPKLLTL